LFQGSQEEELQNSGSVCGENDHTVLCLASRAMAVESDILGPSYPAIELIECFVYEMSLAQIAKVLNLTFPI
jgi:hypothetical protein